MASKAQSGLGSTLAIGGVTGASGTPPTPIVIGECMNIPFEEPEWKTESTTNLSSTIEEIVPTIPGLTSIEIMLNRVANDAGQLALEAAYRANPQVPHDFTLQLPLNPKAAQTTKGDSWVFPAYVVKGVSFEANPDKVIQGKVKLTLVGMPAFTAGS